MVGSSCEAIEVPFRSKLQVMFSGTGCHSHILRFDDMGLIFGEAVDVAGDNVTASLFQFHPGSGFKGDGEHCKACAICIPKLADRPINMFKGAHFMCYGAVTGGDLDSSIEFSLHTAVYTRPDFSPEHAWTAVHMFAGGFNGWEQAAQWVHRSDIPALFSQRIEIDADERVMHLWEAKYQQKVRKCPIDAIGQWDHHEHVGVWGAVHDKSILNLLQSQVNVMVSMSPPCQSWSRAGKQKGLSSDNGIAFADGLFLSFCMQAVTIVAECSDEITTHVHFQTLKHLAAQFGYRLIWSQTVFLHRISPHYRTRWLGVWTRADLPAIPFDTTVHPSVPSRLTWTHDDFSFVLPRSWISQMLLSDSEKAIYGDPALLPASRKPSGRLAEPSQTQVLQSRVLQSSDIMPTLCASYSDQHNLDFRHVTSRGLFTMLQFTPEGFAFFDPARFVVLLGATCDQILPTKLPEAFRIVGNAIATPHALLAMLISLQSMLSVRIDIQGEIRACWGAKLTSANSIVFQVGDLVRIVRHINCAPFLQVQTVFGSEGHFRLQLELRTDGAACHGNFQKTSTFGSCLRALLVSPSHVRLSLHLEHNEHRFEQAVTLQDLANISLTWHLLIGAHTLGTLSLSPTSQQEQHPHSKRKHESIVVDISPTIPFSIRHNPGQHQPLLIRQADFEQTVHHLLHLGLFPLLEQLTRAPVTQHSNFTILVPEHGISFACWIPTPEHDQTVQQVHSATKTPVTLYKQFTMPCLHSVIVLSTQEDPCQPHCVILIVEGSPPFWASTVPRLLLPKQTFRFQEALYLVHTVNHQPAGNQAIATTPGDLLSLHPVPIRAGGHHNQQQPLVLAPNANFTTRAEFAANTHGWLAADEMAHVCQMLQWSSADAPRFSPPVYWDCAQSDFDEGPFGPLAISDDGHTNIPILAGNHWCALEIQRDNTGVAVTTVQVTPQWHTRIILIIARILDIAPHRMRIHHDANEHTPHLCGWQLLLRWATELGIHDTLARVDSQAATSPEHNDQIALLLQASIEDWHKADASPAMWAMAARLRRHFFVTLARKDIRDGHINQRPIATAFPPVQQPIQNTPAHHEHLRHQQSVHQRISDKLERLNVHPGWASSDEINLALEGPRTLLPDTLICPPAVWNEAADLLHFPHAPEPPFRVYQHILWIIMDGNHWLLIECYKCPHHAHFYIKTPPNTMGRLLPLIQRIRTDLDYNGSEITLHCLDQVNPDGMCGQAIVAEIHHRLGITLPFLSQCQLAEIQASSHAHQIANSLHLAHTAWADALATPDLIRFANAMRHRFLLAVSRNQFPVLAFAAGAGSAAMDTSSPKQTTSTGSQPVAAASKNKPDLLWHNDPWLKKTPKQTQARWEDLSLQSPIPFHGTDGRPMVQTHRLQVSQARARIILTTKQHVSELVKLAGTLDFALLVPTVDGVKPSNLYHALEGPYEITVEDSHNKTAYKRLVLMAVITGKISYKLPEPKLKLHTAAVAEIVLEIDSRLHSSSDFGKMKEQPLQTFKHLLTACHPDTDATATLYGIRVTKHPGGGKSDQQLQCMLKIPVAHRTPLLEASGQTALLTRDFIDHASDQTDTTVLPRFWPVTQQDVADLRVTTKGITGASGIIVTRRGLALRVWTKQIAAARKASMPGDPRLTDENRHVIPRISFQASGWPQGTDPPSVVKSMLEATSIAAVPTRTFRAAGVHTWILTAEDMPTVTRFTVDANGSTHEILLQPLPQNTAAAKGNGKGKQRGRKPTGPDEPPSTWGNIPNPLLGKSKQDDERLNRLEARIEQLDQRQSSFETRVESKFDHISDSLRQILAASHSRSREVSGETPPSKFPKQN